MSLIDWNPNTPLLLRVFVRLKSTTKLDWPRCTGGMAGDSFLPTMGKHENTELVASYGESRTKSAPRYDAGDAVAGSLAAASPREETEELRRRWLKPTIHIV